MRRKIINKVTALAIAGVVVISSYGSISAASTTSIGKVRFSNEYRTATATTTISTAPQPATGFTAFVQITTYNDLGTKKVKNGMGDVSQIYVDRTAAKGHWFTRAEGLHKQCYRIMC